MATYKINDLIKHDEFAAYVQQAMLDRSTLIKSGIAAVDPAIAEKCNAAGAGGDFVHLPFFKELDKGTSHEAAPLKNDGTDAPVQTAETAEDIAVICTRVQAFGAADLDALLAGADPMLALSNGLADWWNKEHNRRLIATLNGALGAVSTLVKDITGETNAADKVVTADALLDAAQLLGDRKSELTAYAMSSATETHLQKLEGSDLFKPSELPGNLKVYNGRLVIVDDNIENGEVYLFAPGAVAYNQCPYKASAPQFEPFREELKSQGGIVTRDRSIIHVRGIKWATTDTNPTNATLATAEKWARVYETKAIRVCKLVGTLG
jgi:hypothetical protein